MGLGPWDPSQGAEQYLRVKAVGRAWAGGPLPAGECRHQAATARRRSPQPGECTPQSNPPLLGSQTPGREGGQKGGDRPSPFSPACLPVFLTTVPHSPSRGPRSCHNFRPQGALRLTAPTPHKPARGKGLAGGFLPTLSVHVHLTLKPTSPRLQQRQVRRRKMKASRPEQDMRTTA